MKNKSSREKKEERIREVEEKVKDIPKKADGKMKIFEKVPVQKLEEVPQVGGVTPEVRKIVPFKKERINVGKIKHQKKEPESQRFIRSIDDLDRLKRKINERKKLWAFKGIGTG